MTQEESIEQEPIVDLPEPIIDWEEHGDMIYF